jgi:hypothetical protein
MAKRKGWGVPTAAVGALAIGLIGGVVGGRWLLQEPMGEGSPLASSRAPAATAVIPPSPPPPIQPEPVIRLSDIPDADPGLLIAHLVRLGGGEPSEREITGFVALTQCPALTRANAAQREELAAMARGQLATLATNRRVRVSVSLPPAAQGVLALPSLAEPMRLRVATTAPSDCAELFAASDLPRMIDLTLSGPAPWPASQPVATTAAGSLFGDLVLDMGERSTLDSPAGVAIAAKTIALYVWSDASRRTPLAALGFAAPDSQDVPIAKIPNAQPDAAPLAGRPVSAELARRAAQTSGVALPPINTAPRQSVEMQALPPPLINR